MASLFLYSQPSDPTVLDSTYQSCCGASPVEYHNFNADAHVFVPNIFTPNGDGQNDRFQPFVNGNIDHIEDFQIFSLTGDSLLFYRQVFDFNDVENYGWNGIRPDETIINVQAVSNGIPGQVIVSFDDQTPGGLQTHAFEWRDAELTAWNNGQYDSRSKAVLNGLPNLKRVDIRVRSLCTRGRVSSWSDFVTAAVL